MIRYRTGLAAIVLIAGVGQAQTRAPGAAAPTAPAVATAEAHVRDFLFNLQGGKTAEAVDGLLGTSTTPSQKPGERENLLTQIGAAIQAYGPVTAYEKARSEMLGTMVMRQFYLVQHRDMVVRWEFEYVRTAAGWQLDYFGFDDQPRTWF
jgi:hypothetical protein